MTGRNKDKERGFSHRSLSEEEIEKLGSWQVGTFHRGSTSSNQSSADDPMRPAAEALEKQGMALAARAMAKGKKAPSK